MNQPKIGRKALWKEMFFWNLKFKDKQMEKNFEEEKQCFQKVMLIIFLIIIGIFSFVLWLTKFVSPYPFSGLSLIFNIIKTILMIFCTILVWKKPASTQFVGIIVLLFMFIGVLESAKINLEFMTIPKSFLYGLSIESIYMCPLLMRLAWQINFGFAFITNCYIVVRFLDLKEHQYSVIICFCNFLLLVIVSYIIESYERESFYLIRKKESSLRKFQDLIENVIPLGVLISQNNKVAYRNSEFQRIIKPSASADGFRDFQNINMIEFTEIETREPRASFSDSMLFNSNLTSRTITLFEFITAVNNGASSTMDVFKGKITSSDVETPEKYISIHSTDIVWKNKAAKIIFFKEDPNLLKISLLQQREKERGIFLASISHELRTPLNSVIGMITWTQDRVQNKELFESLEFALSSSNQLLFLINDILDYIQLNSGRFTNNIRSFYVEELLESVFKENKPLVEQKGLEFYLENRTVPSCKARCKTLFQNDPLRLKQVLMNLISNAIKYTSKGFIKLSYRIIEIEYPGDEKEMQFPYKGIKLLCSVEDSGQGIKRKHLDSLFKMFRKTDELDSPAFHIKGLGMGLAMCKELIKKMNENWKTDKGIDVHSEFGKGSTFSFEIFSADYQKANPIENEPIIAEIYYRQAQPSARIPQPLTQMTCYTNEDEEIFIKELPQKKIKILVVDDDKFNIVVASKYLGHYDDIEFKCAFNGEEAVNIIKETASNKKEKFFDLVLMDCNMPIMDGFTATKELRLMIRNKQIPHVNIVAVTANVLQSDLERCLKCGMADYLTKPYTREQLRNKIDMYAH